MHRVVFAHDPALFVAIGALYLKQEALRSAGGKTLTPALEDEVDRLIGRGVRDAAWFYKGWSGAIEKYLSAEDADEIAVHFTTEGGRLQQRVIELAVAEVLASIYTFTDKIDYRITASKRELLELQSAMDQRLLKGIQDFSVYPNAVKFANDELVKLGPLTRQEKILLVVFIVVVILWITAKLHGIDATVIALLGIAFLLITQVLEWSDVINETHAWEVFIWYGGLVMMASALGETNLPKLFAEGIAGVTNGWTWPTALLVLALVYFYAHYGFASITAHVTAMFIPFLAVTVAVGAPAGLTVLVLTYFSNLSAGLTHYGTTPAPIYFGTGYVKQSQWWTIGLIASILNILIWSTVGLG